MECQSSPDVPDDEENVASRVTNQMQQSPHRADSSNSCPNREVSNSAHQQSADLTKTEEAEQDVESATNQ